MKKVVPMLRALVPLLALSLATPVLAEEAEESQRNKPDQNVVIMYTSDVHCGIDQNFGYAGLQQVRDTMEKAGCYTLLIDDGDSVQGESVGTMTRGEVIIDLMNDLHYDVAIPGNHDFDYGMEQFFHNIEQADFPFISCNFEKNGELVFDPYVIKEVGGIKIGFVGVTTPRTPITSTPRYFQDENGNYIYDFMQDTTGERVYKAVQDAVDQVRAEGADYVFLMGHLGNEAVCSPWTYADVLGHTSGIDLMFDGHSHDTDQVTMKNKDGEDVTRVACGTKLEAIGYAWISAEDGSISTSLHNYIDAVSLPELLDIQNEMRDRVSESLDELDEKLGDKVGKTAYDLCVHDPTAVDESGSPIRIIRSAETNLGDFCADAFRDQSGADIAFENGGGIRVDIFKGDITLRDLLNVHPFGNYLTVIEATGQQILDALEWTARSVPTENGGFLQVSGMTYEIHTYIESSATSDDNGMCTGIPGEYRVKNVTIGGEPLDPGKTYTVAGSNYVLVEHGDGMAAFDGCKVVQDQVKLDNQVLIDYLVETLDGVVSEKYADPYGEGRIIAVDKPQEAAGSVAEEAGSASEETSSVAAAA